MDSDSCRPRDKILLEAKKEFDEVLNDPILLSFLQIVRNHKTDITEQVTLLREVRQQYGLGNVTLHQLFGEVKKKLDAANLLFDCPCCRGLGYHIRSVREYGEKPYQANRLCETCEGKGRLDWT